MHAKAIQHRIRVVEIATNPKGYCVHACEVLKHCATDENQPTLARYHISGHNFNLDISHSYTSVIGHVADVSYNVFEQLILSYQCIIGVTWRTTTTMPMKINVTTCFRIWTEDACSCQSTHATVRGCNRPHINSQCHKRSITPLLRPGPFPLAGECPVLQTHTREWSYDPML